jgi:hypothetical protein
MDTGNCSPRKAIFFFLLIDLADEVKRNRCSNRVTEREVLDGWNRVYASGITCVLVVDRGYFVEKSACINNGK